MRIHCALLATIVLAIAGPARGQSILAPDASVDDRQLAAAVTATPDAMVVLLAGCDRLTDAATAASLAKLGRLHGATIAGSKALGNASLGALRAATGLRALAVRGCPKVTDAGLGWLRGAPLERLELRGTSVPAASFARLADVATLTSLALDLPKLRDADLRPLARMQRLAALELVGPLLTDKAFDHAGAAPCLTSLRIRAGTIDGSRFAALAHLERLVLLEGTTLDPAAAPRFAELPALTDLGLPALAEPTAAALVLPPRLRRLRLARSPNLPDAAVAALLDRHPELERVDLAGDSVGPASLAALARLPRLRAVSVAVPVLELGPLAGRAVTVTFVGAPPLEASVADMVEVEAVNTYVVRPGAGTTKCQLRLRLPSTLDRRQVVHAIALDRAPHRIYQVGNDRFAELVFEAPRGEARVEVTYRATVLPYDLARARAQRSPLGVLVADDRARLVAAAAHLEVDDPTLRQVAALATAKDPVALALDLQGRVAERMTYGGFQADEIGAARAWALGRGDCSEYSDLFATLCRARGIPARVVSGIMFDATPSSPVVRHAWVEAYFDGLGWVPFDPTHADVPNTPPDRIRVPRIRECSGDHPAETYVAVPTTYGWYHWGDPVAVDWTLRSTRKAPGTFRELDE